MQRITWYALLAIVALVAPTAGQSKTAQTQAPQPTIREIATIPGVSVVDAVRMPNGRVVIYTTGDNIFAYDLASKRSVLVTPGFEDNLTLSAAGDRLAYVHTAEDGKTSFIWSIPIKPTTGAAAGPAQRVTITAGNTPTFSPDGKLVAFEVNPSHPGSPEVPYLAVVPTVGGSERVIAKYDRGIGSISWSADGKWIFLRVGGGRDPSASIQRVPVAGGVSETVMSYSTPVAGSGTPRGSGQIVTYRPDTRAVSEGRMAYMTTSGVHGEFEIPAGSWSGSNIDGGSALSLLTKATRPPTEGAPTTTIYELDMSPILKTLVKK